MKKVLISVVLFFCILYAATSTQTLSFQGKLLDNTGAAVTATKAMTFTLYPQATGGTAVPNATWSQSVAVQNGIYSVELDASAVSLSSINDAWMEVTVAGETLSPRIHLTSSMFSQKAVTANYSNNAGLLNGKTENTIVPSGVIWQYAGSVAPAGFLICDGSTVNRTIYAALFAAIGTTYGAGDGSSTFNLPDFREAAPVGLGTRVNGVTTHDAFTLGQFKDDQIQGHMHYLQTRGDYVNIGTGGALGGWGFNNDNANAGVDRMGTFSASTDGSNGNPRIGSVTRGKGVGVNFIIKY